MTRRCVALLLGLICLLACLSAADAAELARGINLTNWFRYPPSRDPAALESYMSDRALRDLHAAGFDFIRLAVDPEVVSGQAQTAALLRAVRRVEAVGMAVVIAPHPHDWHLEADAADRERLRAFWRQLAPRLAVLDQSRILPEVLNEPVFPGDPAGWATLQHLVLADIRQALPRATVVLTGQDWGSIGGLLALTPEPDRNVLYSFHFYGPSELTSLAAYRHDVDHTALGRLPFPVDDQPACDAVAEATADAGARGMMHYYCAYGWDAGRIGAELGRAAEWSLRHDVRLLAGEFGASVKVNAPARQAWMQTVRQALEARGLAWALWGYDDSMGFALPQPPGARPALDRAVLSALGMTTPK